MTKKFRFMTRLLAVVLAVVMLFSAVYIAVEADHDCSGESEASFETVSFLAKKVDELKLPCVLTIEGKNHKIAETIVENTAEKNQKILTMDSMQSTTSEDVANGTTYLSVMEQNLSMLKEALG